MDNFPKRDINEKNFEFAKDLARECKEKAKREEIIKLLRFFILPTSDGRLSLSIFLIHQLISSKAWLLYQENKKVAEEFLTLPILKQLQKIEMDRNIKPEVFKKVKKEILPWLNKFVSLRKKIPNSFEEKYILSSNRSMQNIYNYNLLIQKTKTLDSLNEMDKGLITLNYYLMLLEGPFEDWIDFIFAVIFLIEGKIEIPSPAKPKVINKLDEILSDNFTLGWKKAGLTHYNLPYLSLCLDNKLRNEIAHLKYQITERGQIYREDGTELKDLFDKQEELMHVIDSFNEVFGEVHSKQLKPGIEEILEKISMLVEEGTNPWHMNLGTNFRHANAAFT